MGEYVLTEQDWSDIRKSVADGPVRLAGSVSNDVYQRLCLGER
jgi:hypothetical protein